MSTNMADEAAQLAAFEKLAAEAAPKEADVAMSSLQSVDP